MADTLKPQSDAERRITQEVKGTDVCPEFLRAKADEIEAKIASTCAAVADVVPTAVSADATVDSSEFAPRLAKYKANYDSWTDELKAKLSWDEIASRLIANNALLLSRAESMNGVLFGVDENNKAVFAPEQKEPEAPLKMNYAKSRDAVMFETDKQTGKKTSTGYELFDEALIKQFEQFTGHPVVASESGEEYRSIWLENGENPIAWARLAYFRPVDGRALVADDGARFEHPFRGVRRLLRV